MTESFKIMVADDDQQILDMLKKLLEKNNYEVVTATSGDQALNIAALEKPDLAILDVSMPCMDGIEATRRLKAMELTRNIPIIIFTGIQSVQERINAFKAGASDIIAKPVVHGELLMRVAVQLKVKLFQDHIANYNKHLEAEVSMRTEQLQRAMNDVNRFAEASHLAGLARAEFLNNISHELRTPLNGIMGMAHLALDTNLDEEQRDCIETVITASNDLLNIINDTLDFSEIEKGKISLIEAPFNIRSWFEDIAGMMRDKVMENKLALKSHIAANIPDDLIGDPYRLRQVLVNLAGNAIKFTEKGVVSLDISIAALAPEKITLRFAVTDTGIGIEPKKQQQMFDAFEQSDGSLSRKHGGLGLGLSISDRLVKLMGGQIHIESELGKGSTINFTANLTPLEKGDGVHRDLLPDCCEGSRQADHMEGSMHLD